MQGLVISSILTAIVAATVVAQFPQNPANCADDRPILFLVKTIQASNVGVNFGELIPNLVPTDPNSAGLISLVKPQTVTSAIAFALSPSGALSIILTEPVNAEQNTAVSVSCNFDASSNVSKFHPVVTVPDGQSNDTFVLIPFEGNQLLMVNPSNVPGTSKQWVVCDSDKGPLLAWTDKAGELTAEDFGTQCNKVQLQVTDCAIPAGKEGEVPDMLGSQK